MVMGMSRRGKFLSIALEGGGRLFLHLRMTGQLLVTPHDFPMEKHTHLIVNLSGGSQVRYIDVRRFGRFWYLENGEDISVTGMNKLGIEPTSRKLTAAYLREMLGRHKKSVKEMLLDQSVIAGIGNIYSDEILFAAKIHPNKQCPALSAAEWKRLSKKIPEIIQWAIESNTTSPEEYLAGQGKEYRNTPFLKVYGHAGRPCPECGSPFEKITVGGRSSCFCPKCQKEKSPLN